jgi:NtrC-family two-component system sensor histidine kinase KinB
VSASFEAAAVALAALIVLIGIVESAQRHGRILRGLGVLRQAVRRMRSGDLGARVRLRGHDEVAQLGDELNGLGEELARLHAAADPKRPREDAPRLRQPQEGGQDWIATVAHELRTPLTSVRMALHLCLEEAAGPLTERQRELLAAAREDGERLQSTADELLDISRIQAGRIDLDLAPVPVMEIASTVRDAHERLAAARGVALTVEVLPDCPALHADRERATLALGNLVGNAVRHTPTGGHVVIAAQAEGTEVRFEVGDEGEGIPLEYQARVFDRFFRIPGRPGGASGLGLSIARDVVRAHGGRIGVESEPGRGSRFWFTLPMDGTRA